MFRCTDHKHIQATSECTAAQWPGMAGRNFECIYISRTCWSVSWLHVNVMCINVLDCKCIAFFMLYCIAANMWLLKTVKIICSLCVVQKCFVLWTKVSKRWAHQSRGPFDSVNDATAISQRECHGNGFLSWACGIAKTSLFSISDFGRSSNIP